MKNLFEKEKGITLIALIITIVVVLILAGITIATITGENGILTKALATKEATRGGEVQEYINLTVNDNKISEYTSETKKTKEDVIRELREKGKLTEEETKLESANIINIGGLDVDFSKLPGQIDSYVGYYADIEGDGTVDGIIYADLLVGGSGKWGEDDSIKSYTIPPKGNLKEYYIKEESYTGSFGTHPVVAPVDETTGNDRFYVMALSDVEKVLKPEQILEYTWYNGAEGKMSDFNKTTSEDFGTGKENTTNMIKKWNDEEYGEHIDYVSSSNPNYTTVDLWGQVQEQFSDGWFVPSIEEWGAFIDQLDIKSIMTESGGPMTVWGDYWSSSQIDDSHVWYQTIFGRCDSDFSAIGGWVGNSISNIRLSTTF